MFCFGGMLHDIQKTATRETNKMSDIMILEQGGSSHGFNMKVRQVALFLENEVNLETGKWPLSFYAHITKFESQTRLCLGLLIGTKLTMTI